MESDLGRQLHAATDEIRRKSHIVPHIALILGSGLGVLADEVRDAISVGYDEIPNMPRSTAPGHAGKLVLGTLEGTRVAVLSGRPHLYEGYAAAEIAFPVRVMRSLGAEIILITNAAGGINREYRVGDLMLITDHINLTGQNPLMGHTSQASGRASRTCRARTAQRCVMSRCGRPSEAACPSGGRVSGANGTELRNSRREGLTGPNFETPAEIRMARTLGADAVGMSTVLEAIAAIRCGLQVLGISCITNMATGVLSQTISEREVFHTAEQALPRFARLLHQLVRELG